MSILARLWEPWHFAMPAAAARCPSRREKLPGGAQPGVPPPPAPPWKAVVGDQSLISARGQKKILFIYLFIYLMQSPFV